MKKQKLKLNTIKFRQDGFTIIELLVVLSIMATAFAVVLVGLNQQRIARSVVLAQNETVTNIRKVQSYMLSSRNLDAAGTAAKYYVINFTNSSSYTIGAIDTNYVFHGNLETINLNDNVGITTMTMTDYKNNNVTTPSCVQVIYSAPFGKMYIDDVNCSPNAETVERMVKDPAKLLNYQDRSLVLQMINPRGGSSKIITLLSLSGRVVAN